MSRSIRRHHKQRMKDKFIRKEKARPYWGINEKNINLYANCKKLCSCWMCGNPRKHAKGENKLSKQERQIRLEEMNE